MKKISFAFLCAVALLAFAGCKKKGGSAGEALAKMTEVADKMCACKDKACADKVQDDYVKWGQEMAKKATGDQKAEPMSEADTKKFAEVTKKYTDCMTKLMTPDPAAGGGGAAPDPGAGGGGGGAAPGSADKPPEPPAGSAAPADPAAGSAKPEEKKM